MVNRREGPGRHKPRTAAGYRPEWLEWAKRLCLELSTVLGSLMEELTVVGGLVPALLIPEDALPEDADPHPGTADVDVALSLALLDAERYTAVSDQLRGAGFAPDENERGNRTVQRWTLEGAAGERMTVEFTIQPTGPDDRPSHVKNLEPDFGAVIMEGLHLAFEDRSEVLLSGTSLGREVVDNRPVWVCGPGAYVVLKSLALRGRKENKDAYDLVYVIRNYGEGVEDVASRLRPLLDDPVANKAMAFLAEDFDSIDHPGPVRAAAFVGSEGDDASRADARGFVRELLRRIGREEAGG